MIDQFGGNMRYLVTGGAGFIGSHLCDTLLAQEHEVTAIDDMSTGQWANIQDALQHPKFHFVQNNVLDFWDKNRSLSFDCIFHLAAMARIQPSFDDPGYTFRNNAYGTSCMLDYARRIDARFVYSGSSTFYFDPFANPYAFSKWIGEEACRMYYTVYDVPVGIARFFNVYGKRQIEKGPYSTVIGIFERQYRNHEPLTITGTGEQRRDFTAVEDIVSGLIAIENHLAAGNKELEVFALGTGRNYSINEIADLFGSGDVKYLPRRPGEAEITLADIARTKEVLGWEPQHRIEDYVKNFLSEWIV